MIPLTELEAFLYIYQENGKEKNTSRDFPFSAHPDMGCHLCPAFVAINGGMKLAGADVDEITNLYCQDESIRSKDDIKPRLEGLKEIWEIILSARKKSEEWGKSFSGKTRREKDNEDLDRLSQLSRRTTRSQYRPQDQGDRGLGKEQSQGTSAGNQPRRHQLLSEPGVDDNGQKSRIHLYLSRIHKRVRRWITLAQIK